MDSNQRPGQRPPTSGYKPEVNKANTELNKQRQRAEDREQQAINAVERFRAAVANNPALKNNPAHQGPRKTLLKEPPSFFRKLFDTLKADHDTRPEALARLAQAAFELGSLTREIGDRQHALAAHQYALDIGERLAREHPESPDFASDLGVTLGNVAAIDLVRQRQALLKDAWLTATGHKRPGKAQGLPLPEATKRAETLSTRIRAVQQ